MKISDIIIEYIKSKWVERIYWLSWKYNESLYISAENNKLDIIQNIHENNSVFFASWDYEATKNINFVFVTEWPWITNLITSTACSFIDNIPLLIISINNSTYSYWLWTHHDCSSSFKDWIDIVWIMKEVTSYSLMVNDSNSLLFILNKAYNIALMDNKPVHISIPENFLDLEINSNLLFDFKKIYIDDFKWSFEWISKFFNNSDNPLFITWNNIDSDIFIDFIKNTNSLYANVIWNHNLYLNIKNYIWMIDIVYSKYIDKILDKVDIIFILNSALNNFTISWYYNKFKSKKIIHISSDKNDISFLSLDDYSFINSDSNLLLAELRNNTNKKWNYNLGVVDKLYSFYNDSFLQLVDEQWYLKFFNILNSTFKENDVIYISVWWLHNYGWLYLRPDNKIKVYFPWRFFSLWTSMRSCWYSLASDKRVFLLIGDWDFIMNWLDVSVILEKKVNLNIILFNNNWYKSLNGRDYNNFWNKYNFKKICEWFGINYQKTDIENLWNLIDNLDKTWINLIEYKKI